MLVFVLLTRLVCWLQILLKNCCSCHLYWSRSICLKVVKHETLIFFKLIFGFVFDHSMVNGSDDSRIIHSSKKMCKEISFGEERGEGRQREKQKWGRKIDKYEYTEFKKNWKREKKKEKIQSERDISNRERVRYIERVRGRESYWERESKRVI